MVSLLTMKEPARQTGTQPRALHPDAPSRLPDASHFRDNREDAETCLSLVLSRHK